jgi:hypothetical protein
LDVVADQIKERFGTDALHRARGLLHGAEHRPVAARREEVDCGLRFDVDASVVIGP